MHKVHNLKVTLEVTAQGWACSVLDGTKQLARQEMRREDPGSYRGTEKASKFEKALEKTDLEDLLDPIDNIDLSEICEVLASLE